MEADSVLSGGRESKAAVLWRKPSKTLLWRKLEEGFQQAATLFPPSYFIFPSRWRRVMMLYGKKQLVVLHARVGTLTLRAVGLNPTEEVDEEWRRQGVHNDTV